MPCADCSRFSPFCDECLALEAAEPEPVYLPPQPRAACWCCGNAGPMAGDECEACERWGRNTSGRDRHARWLAARG